MKISSASQQAYAAAQKTGQSQKQGQPKASSGAEAPKDSVTLGEYTDSKTLIQQTLLDQVGSKIEEMLNAHGLSLSDAEGQDWSPEAVSQRIVDFTTGFYGMYKQQHPEMSEEEALTAFEGLVRGAVDDGAGKAMGILAGQGMDGQVKSVVGETMSLVHSKLDDFFGGLRQQLSAPQEQEA